ERYVDGSTAHELEFTSELQEGFIRHSVPTVICKPAKEKGRLPAVIVLHGTGGSKESANVKSFMSDLVKRNIIGVAIDARYHGARSILPGTNAYNNAIIKAWLTKPGEPIEHPFYYDTVWDLWRLVDYLETRDDIDADYDCPSMLRLHAP